MFSPCRGWVTHININRSGTRIQTCNTSGIRIQTTYIPGIHEVHVFQSERAISSDATAMEGTHPPAPTPSICPVLNKQTKTSYCCLPSCGHATTVCGKMLLSRVIYSQQHLRSHYNTEHDTRINDRINDTHRQQRQ